MSTAKSISSVNPPQRPDPRRSQFHLLLLACGLLAFLQGHGDAAGPYVPDFRLHPDTVTVLMACDATHSPELKPFQPAGHGKFFVTGWKHAEESAAWTLRVPAEEQYAVNVLLLRRRGGTLHLQVSAGTENLTGSLPANANAWQRQALPGTLRLPQGPATITLRLFSETPGAGFEADVLSVELVRPAIRAQLHRAAMDLRSNTTWLQAAKYGFMVHWTSQTCPRHGSPKPYADAVRDFDVEAFANQAQEGGAGFVVLTTSHGFHYFPAPLATLDKLLPGRTSQRDLVGDLADALQRRGIKLMLYYHLGAGSDPAWLAATGFWETAPTRLFANWCDLVGEVGRRYQGKLAGWWFDDGTTSYYYRSAPWQQLTLAAKAGNPDRLVAYNPWILPPATEFQDYFCGEGFEDPAGDGTLAPGGDGHYTSGPYAGLQACATLITEGDWGHFSQDRPIGKFRWSAAELAGRIGQFAARRNVPIFDLEIYQDGTVSPESIATFREARRLGGIK